MSSVILQGKPDLWLVVNGLTPIQLTYSSVVNRDSIRIAFLVAMLNDINILAADIGNTYLQAPAQEKVYTTAGPELVQTM